MKHHRIAAALASVAVLSAIAACSSGSGASSSPSASASGTASGTASSSASAAAGYNAAHAGGTLHLVANAAGGTLDPQINYTLQYWQLYQAPYHAPPRFRKG